MSQEAKRKMARYLALSAKKTNNEISPEELDEMASILQELDISHADLIKAATAQQTENFDSFE